MVQLAMIPEAASCVRKIEVSVDDWNHKRRVALRPSLKPSPAKQAALPHFPSTIRDGVLLVDNRSRSSDLRAQTHPPRPHGSALGCPLLA